MNPKHFLVIPLLLRLTLPSPAEELAVTSIVVHAAHPKESAERIEKIRASRTGDGARLTITVEQEPEEPVETSVALDDGDWRSLVRLVNGRDLAAWDAPASPAAGWGSEGFAITGSETTKRSWSGPFDGWAPPLALFDRMAELAHKLAPKSELQHFKASAPPVTKRIRMWNLWRETAPRNGAPSMEVEAEERGGKWMLVAREGASGPEDANEVRSAELTKEEWEALKQMATEPELTQWDGRTGTAESGWGTLGVETDLGENRVVLSWHRDTPEGRQPRKLWETLYLLASRKDLLETRGER